MTKKEEALVVKAGFLTKEEIGRFAELNKRPYDVSISFENGTTEIELPRKEDARPSLERDTPEDMWEAGGNFKIEDVKHIRAVYSGSNKVKITAINENMEIVEKEINID